jgi:hypothetical protein
MLVRAYLRKNAEQEIWKFDAAMQVQINDTPKQAAMEGQWNEMGNTREPQHQLAEGSNQRGPEAWG